MSPLRLGLNLTVIASGAAVVVSALPGVEQKPYPREQARAAQLAAARRERIPTRLQDRQAKGIEPARNAATYLRKVAVLDKASPVPSDQSVAISDLSYHTNPTPAQLAQGRKALEAHAERLHLIHQAADCETYAEPPQTMQLAVGTVVDDFPRFALFRDCARWLVAEGVIALYDGRPQDAIKSDALTFRLARQVASTGSVVSFLVGAAVDGIGLSGMRRILYHSGRDAAVAEAVRQAIETQSNTLKLAAAFRGEPLQFLVLSESMRNNLPKLLRGDPNWVSQPKAFVKTAEYRAWTRKWGYPRDPKLAALRYLDMNDAHLLAWMRRAIAVADRPYPEARRRLEAIAREAEKVSQSPDYALAAAPMQTLALLPASKARHQAAAEMVAVGAAVLAWRARQGRLPDTLKECLADVPLDPFDLRPLRYRKEGDGFVVYSVGESGKFNGGKSDRKPAPTDVLFRYPLPAIAQK